MSEIGDEDAWLAGIDRRGAVELLAADLARLEARRPDKPSFAITLLRAAWELILAAAKDGMNTGKGRPRDTRGDKVRKAAVAAGARKRKTALVAKGMKATDANSAEDKAAEEAREFAFERYGISLSCKTIKRMMQSEE